ncbi:MAG: VCBS repeat-containing protein, partial [Bacteroidetes bacterium]|nr:VCBS repeat-containing protein [Bacteroidota bacterium]
AEGDFDLVVGRGGRELEQQPALSHEGLYPNNGGGGLPKASRDVPKLESSGKAITSADMDGDGDLDLFVGGRLVVGKYPFAPRSYVLKNEGGIFTDVTALWAPAIKNAGLVTDATWVDWNTDGKQDLLVVGEWMSVKLLENNGSTLVDVSAQYGLDKQKGWWKSVEVADFDQDGDLDFVLGNNGLNYKYHATQKEPFHVYAHDFDKNGSMDIVLGYFNKGTLYPVRGRQCSSEQCPEIKEKFATYSAFGSADLKSVYGADLDLALHYTVTNFASVYIENKGADGLVVRKLPQQAQFSVVNAIVAEDIDADGHLDLILSGNLHVSEVETPRNDASIGVVLKGNGDGTFAHWPVNETGYFTPGDVKDIALLKQNNKRLILVANNDAAMQVFEF